MSTKAPFGVALLALVVLGGCASTTEPTATAGGAGTGERAASAARASQTGTVNYQKHEHLQRVWLAEGFRFQGYDTLYIAETEADVAKLNPDGVQNLEWAKGALRDELVTAIESKKIFTSVVTRASDIKPGARTLRLHNIIIEYEKGGGGARFFAGLYGAGQPVLKVRGRLVGSGDQPLFMFESKRSGDSGLSRTFGGYRSDKDIQKEDIRDLAQDMADYMVQTSARGR